MAQNPEPSTLPSAGISLGQPEFLGCPQRYYALMRREGAVYREPGTGNLVVTTDAEVREVLSDSKTYSSRTGSHAQPPPERLQAQLSHIWAQGWARPAVMILGDAPDQTRERRLVAPFVSPRAVERLRPTMRRVIDQLLDDVDTAGEVDFVNAVAIPFSVKIICKVLGVPEQDWRKIQRFTDADSAAYGAELDDGARLAAEADVVEMQHYYVDRVLALRDQPPTNELMSAIAHAGVPTEDGGHRALTDAEIAELCRQMQTGGNETTRKYFCDLVVLLALHPDVYAEFRHDRTKAKGIIEESLRLAAQLQLTHRTVTTQDAQLGSCPVPHGASVLPSLAAANRDPAVYPEPDRFDYQRPNAGRHLTFGKGAHVCPGANITRAETEELLNALADRWSSIELVDADDLEYEPSFMIRSLKSVRLRVHRT